MVWDSGDLAEQLCVCWKRPSTASCGRFWHYLQVLCEAVMSPLIQARPWGETLYTTVCRIDFQTVWVLLFFPRTIIIIILAFSKHGWHNLKQPSPTLTKPESRIWHLQYESFFISIRKHQESWPASKLTFDLKGPPRCQLRDDPLRNMPSARSSVPSSNQNKTTQPSG